MTVGVLAVQEPIASKVTAVPNVVSCPTVILRIPPVTDAVVAVPACVTFGTLISYVYRSAATPGVVTDTLDTAVSVTVNCGNVPSFQLVTSSIVSVVWLV